MTIRIQEPLLKELDSLAEILHLDRSTLVRKIILDNFEEFKKRVALDLYLTYDYSAEKAAATAGVPLTEFLDYLQQKGVATRLDVDTYQKLLKAAFPNLVEKMKAEP